VKVIALAVVGLGLCTISLARADGSGANGENLFKHKCASCHSVESGNNRVGPTLFGVVGRKAASIETYSYSTAMRSAELTWDPVTLDSYLTNARPKVPGTKMTFVGLPHECPLWVKSGLPALRLQGLLFPQNRTLDSPYCWWRQADDARPRTNATWLGGCWKNTGRFPSGLLLKALQDVRRTTPRDLATAEVSLLAEASSPDEMHPHQEIQFCHTPDGVRIAYAAPGQGMPILKTGNWLTHLDYDWQSPVWRHWMRQLACDFRRGLQKAALRSICLRHCSRTRRRNSQAAVALDRPLGKRY